MGDCNGLGRIIILNGPPRSGKSTIAAKIQEEFDGLWINFGVDHMMKMIPNRYQPSIGLRPGGERPDLESHIEKLYLGMYNAIASFSKRGINVVVDVGHHNYYSTSLKILPQCAKIVADLPVLLIGVRCNLEEIMQRRIQTGKMGFDENGNIPKPILRWQQYVHEPGIYDLELDTLKLSPIECVDYIKKSMEENKFGNAIRKIIME